MQGGRGSSDCEFETPLNNLFQIMIATVRPNDPRRGSLCEFYRYRITIYECSHKVTAF